MPIEDLARSDAVTAAPETPVAELAATMDEEIVGSVVITSDETPVGIVTDRDLSVRILGEQVDPTDQTAADVMTTELCTAEPDAGFYEAATLMADHGIRRLPLCEGDTLVGIISADDITELLADEQQLLENLIRNAVEHGGNDVTVTLGDIDGGFFIEDDGPGIPSEDRLDVFDAGYSTRPSGNGFGLSIVKQVADAHTWSIGVTEGTAGGARFEVTGVDLPEEGVSPLHVQ